MAKKKQRQCGYMFRKLGMAQGALLCAERQVFLKGGEADTTLGTAIEDLERVLEEWEGTEVASAGKEIVKIKKSLKPNLKPSQVVELRKKIHSVVDTLDRIEPPGCQ